MSVLVAFVMALLSLFSAADSGGSCEAISGQYADGTSVGVVVYGCDPGGVVGDGTVTL